MAQKQVFVNLNLNGNQLLQTALENVAALPSTGNVAGRVVFLTTDKRVYRYDGAAWSKLLSSDEDMVVESGSVVKGTFASDGSFTENTAGKDTALKLVIAHSSQPVYINVKDLAQVYTGGIAEDITVAISGSNVISATLSNTVKTQLSSIANKVDKVAGKGLSTNDYTTADKNKLAGLSNVVMFKSDTYLTGKEGNVDLSAAGFDSELPIIMQATKDGEEIIMQLVYVAADKVIKWASNTAFQTSDKVIITAMQVQ